MLVPIAAAEVTAPSPAPVSLCVCGATGSIGRSTLDLVRANPLRFRVLALTAHTSARELHALAQEFRPRYIGIGDDAACNELRRLGLPAGCEVAVGEDAVSALAALPEVDVVVAAVVGVAGLRSVEAALSAGKTIALANKESLVAGGALVAGLQEKCNARIIPVDSEHSAIFQALQGQYCASLQSLVLTASGGPFRDTPLERLASISPEEAVRHPRWRMGAKISVDSATMMNKALEVIEAHWLFGVQEGQIEVLVHPQSIIHSMVRFGDGSLLAQLSVPDMKGPISYALSYPHQRVPGAMQQLDLAAIGKLEFYSLDSARFPAVSLAREVLRQGGFSGAVFNSANEAAVQAFLERKLTFDKIVPFVAQALERHHGAPEPECFSQLYQGISELRRVFSSDLGIGILS